MVLKILTHPTTGKTFKMGRRRPIACGMRPSLRNYINIGALPTPPAVVDYSPAATRSLRDVYGNDRLGDCVIAGMAHVEGVLTANAGKEFVYTDHQIVRLYSAIGGYVPGDDSTDNGCDEQTALNYWMQKGAPRGSHEIAGWMTVDGTSQTECMTAMLLFENLYFGVELPDTWVNPMPSVSGFVWDVAGAPDPENGHCFAGVGYTAHGVKIDTWGMLGTVTWPAVAAYATKRGSGGLYCVVSKDALNKKTQKTPAGFDWDQLSADFDSMGGNV